MDRGGGGGGGKTQAAVEEQAEQVELVPGSRTHMHRLTVEYLSHTDDSLSLTLPSWKCLHTITV